MPDDEAVTNRFLLALPGRSLDRLKPKPHFVTLPLRQAIYPAGERDGGRIGVMFSGQPRTITSIGMRQWPHVGQL